MTTTNDEDAVTLAKLIARLVRERTETDAALGDLRRANAAQADALARIASVVVMPEGPLTTDALVAAVKKTVEQRNAAERELEELEASMARLSLFARTVDDLMDNTGDAGAACERVTSALTGLTSSDFEPVVGT